MLWWRHNVSNWYRTDISESAELIESFVKGVETQAAESIARYEQKAERLVVKYETDDKEEYEALVRTHQGLSDESWDLETIFREYFPSLQRRSALLTVWGYFEHELDKLCLLYRSEKNYKIALTDLNGQGIDRSTSYLEKVAGIDAHKNSQEWNCIKNIQKIRNAVAHRDARLLKSDDKALREIIRQEKALSLSAHDEIVLKAGFLAQVTSTYKDYFALIDGSIQANEKQ